MNAFKHIEIIKKQLVSHPQDLQRYYPLDYFTGTDLQFRFCSECNLYIGTFSREYNFCGDKDCALYRGSNKTFYNRQEPRTLQNLLIYWQEYLAINLRLKKELELNPNSAENIFNISHPFGSGLNFIVAGINGYNETAFSNQSKDLIDIQYCLRFNDLPNIASNSRHNLGFFMVGYHTFNRDKSIKKPYLDLLIKSLLSALPNSTIQDFTFNLDFWSDGQKYGPCIQIFISGIQIANLVFMEYRWTSLNPQQPLSLSIDMGLGLERLYALVNPSTYSFKLEDDLYLSFLVSIRSGLLPSKRGVGYNTRRIIAYIREYHKDKSTTPVVKFNNFLLRNKEIVNKYNLTTTIHGRMIPLDYLIKLLSKTPG